METIEQKTASTILQKKKDITIAGKTYQMPVITGATMVLFSEEVSKINIQGINQNENFYKEVFKYASKSKNIAKALAILILGANEIEDRGTNPFTKWLKNIFSTSILDKLTNDIYRKLSIEDMSNLFIKLLEDIQPTVFFSLIIFLNETNVLKPTKETKTTASGQSLEGL